MKFDLRKSAEFLADFDQQFRWYEREAGWDVASRYLIAVDSSLEKLTLQPDLGNLRQFPQPELLGVRSIVVERPFHRHLIFYRFDGTQIFVWRIIHGARDFPRRLL